MTEFKRENVEVTEENRKIAYRILKALIGSSAEDAFADHWDDLLNDGFTQEEMHKFLNFSAMSRLMKPAKKTKVTRAETPVDTKPAKKR